MASFYVCGRYAIQKQYVRLAYHAAAGDDIVSDIERQHSCWELIVLVIHDKGNDHECPMIFT